MILPDAEFLASLTDSAIVALTIFGEARGEPVEGKVAVACVIRNRVAAKRFGMGYRGVCLRPWQFSCWTEAGGASNHQAVLDAARALQQDHAGPVLRECAWAAEGVIADRVIDNVSGATHYLTEALYHTDTVDWAKGLRPSARIHGHVFFSGVA